MEFKDLLEKILDPDNAEPIVLYNDSDEPASFEQLAFIPYKDNYYVVLAPIDELEGFEEGMVLICKIDEENELIAPEQDEDIANEVFAIFVDMAENAGEEE